ncbi:MAG: hypothetical protein JO307_15100 [Bryobacterales bacterium]|nr:hypothetical protein [Bryobacterales bacterium]
MFPSHAAWVAFLSKPESWLSLWVSVLPAISILISAVNLYLLIKNRKQDRVLEEISVKSNNLLNLVSALQKEETVMARNHVYSHLSRKNYNDWDHEDNRMAGLVCGSYNVAGFYVNQNLVEEKMFFEIYGSSLRDMSKFLKEYVEDREGHWKNLEILFERNPLNK